MCLGYKSVYLLFTILLIVIFNSGCNKDDESDLQLSHWIWFNRSEIEVISEANY